MADRPLRLGIAGLGFGGAVHLPVFASLPGVTVAALLARRLDKTQAVAAAHGVPLAVDSLPALLDSGVDAVALALPPAVAAEAASLALDRGIAVLTEKPIAAGAGVAWGLAAKALAMGRLAMVDFTFQELDAFRRLREWIVDGRLGAVRSVTITWLTQSFAHRRGLWSWKVDADAGGGVMAAQGSHIIHLLYWLFGEVTLHHAAYDHRATAAFTPADALPAADGAMLRLSVLGGAPVLVHLSNASPGGGHHRWEVVCDGGLLRLSNQGTGIMGGFSLVLRDADGREAVDLPAPDAGGPDDRLEPFRRLAARFVAAARSGQPAGPDFTDGALVQSMIEMADRLAGRAQTTGPTA